MANHSRTIAIGDIHGCLPALETVLAGVDPQPGDTVITLGDTIDRGPDCRGTLDRLIDLGRRCHLIPLRGNHDDMLLQIVDGRDDIFLNWLLFGGSATLASYDASYPSELPDAHIAFLRGCKLFHESERFIFMHGNYRADLPLAKQPSETLLWDSIKIRQPGPHCSGKTAIVGHASQKSGEVLDLGYLKCIDTWVYGDGWLTALDVDSGQLWQAKKTGERREKMKNKK